MNIWQNKNNNKAYTDGIKSESRFIHGYYQKRKLLNLVCINTGEIAAVKPALKDMYNRDKKWIIYTIPTALYYLVN